MEPGYENPQIRSCLLCKTTMRIPPLRINNSLKAEIQAAGPSIHWGARRNCACRACSLELEGEVDRVLVHRGRLWLKPPPRNKQRRRFKKRLEGDKCTSVSEAQ